MHSYTLLISAIITQFLGLMSPGPDFVLMVKTALTEPKRQAYKLALGISIGMIIHSFYSIFLLPYFLNKTELLLNFFRYAGSIYLVYLGIHAIYSGFKPLQFLNINSLKIDKKVEKRNAILTGFFCSITNPGTILFYVTIFSITLANHTTLMQKTSAAIIMFFLAIGWFSSLAYLLNHDLLHSRVSKIQNFQHFISILSGILFLVFAGFLFFMPLKI